MTPPLGTTTTTTTSELPGRCRHRTLEETPFGGDTRRLSSPPERSAGCYFLGRAYGDDEAETSAEWRRHLASTLYFSYRCGFEEMAPYGYVDDAGWGCMLRSSQMLMAAALLRHVGDARRHQVVRWFADAPGDVAVYSIHNLVRVGMKYDKLPGEWYGPGVAAHVFKDLCEMHDRALGGLKLAMVVTSPEAPLCEDEVLDEMTADSATPAEDAVCSASSSEEDDDDDAGTTTVPSGSTQEDDGQTYDPLLRPPPATAADIARAQRLEAAKEARRSRLDSAPWPRALLVVTPLRAGLAKIEPKFVAPLLACVSWPQSLGFVGGRPRQALFFAGADCRRRVVLGLDPHVVQTSPGLGPGFLSEAHLASLVCLNPRKIHVDALDPSLAFGFYCRDRAEFVDLCDRLRGLRALSDPPLVEVLDGPRADCGSGVFGGPTTVLGEDDCEALCVLGPGVEAPTTTTLDDDDVDDEYVVV